MSLLKVAKKTWTGFTTKLFTISWTVLQVKNQRPNLSKIYACLIHGSMPFRIAVFTSLISAFVKSVLDIHNANPIYILHFKWFNFLYQCYHTIIYKINKTIHWTFLKGKAARIKIFCESSFKLETIIYMNFHCSERWQYNLDYLI